MTDYTLTDTEEMIRPTTPEEDAQYKAIGDQYASLARALLMTVRNCMTAREENECEKATGDHDDPDGFDCNCIDRLVNQYPREIAQWMKGLRS